MITHTDAVSVPGWSGSGYIITYPDTGAGAYKIAGGGDGGVLGFIAGAAIGLFIFGMASLLVVSTILISVVVLLVILEFLNYLSGVTIPVFDCAIYGALWGFGIGIGIGGIFGSSIFGVTIKNLGKYLTSEQIIGISALSIDTAVAYLVRNVNFSASCE